MALRRYKERFEKVHNRCDFPRDEIVRGRDRGSGRDVLHLNRFWVNVVLKYGIINEIKPIFHLLVHHILLCKKYKQESGFYVPFHT